MAKKTDEYRAQLRLLASPKELEAFLKSHSGLPGPRGNLELAHAFAQVGPPELVWRFARLEAAAAPENTPEVFLAFAGVMGLARLALEGDHGADAMLRRRASDSRWRVREAVATAAQLLGDQAPAHFARFTAALAKGNSLEQRAAVAAVAEPRLLEGARIKAARALLDAVTRRLARAPKPLGPDERVLRQALAYAWSVVVAADAPGGKPVMERWLESADPDIVWLMRENLEKKRLLRADPAWCARWADTLRAQPRRRKASARGLTSAATD
jgi:hypothetical protein